MTDLVATLKSRRADERARLANAATPEAAARIRQRLNRIAEQLQQYDRYGMTREFTWRR